MKFLQKLGKALMLPVAVLPICGILMGIGYYLCPATMQGGDIEGARNLIGLFLVKAGGALIDNMAILFVIGVGVGMSDKNDGTGGIAALASWLMMTTLLSTGFVTTIMPSIADSATKTLAFDKIQNPFIGILAGIIGSLCYNRFKDTKLPDWLSFFSGKRCVAIIAGVVSILVSVVLLFVWPLLFGALVSIGKAIVGFDVVGAGMYLCIPEPSVNSYRITPRIKQCILVRYYRTWRPQTFLGRRDIKGCFMEPRNVHVRFLPMYDVWYSWCSTCYG